MRRSAFLLITSLGAAALYALGLARAPRATNDDSSLACAAQEWYSDDNRPGRCSAARKRSRWSGYTIDDLIG